MVSTSERLRRFAAELAAAGVRPPGTPPPPIDVAALPETARRYLGFMGATAEARDASFVVEWSGRFRLSPRGRWMPFDAIQYDACAEVARYWKMRIRMGGVLPVIARDTYLAGRGRMEARLFDLVRIVDARGPELDTGELVTFVNDAILLAPSMLLDARSSFSHVDGGAFDVAFTEGGRTVSARVFVDESGAVRDFVTTDRFVQDPYRPEHPFARASWSTPIDGWRTVSGRRVPTRGRAVWHLPQGDFVYAEMSPRTAPAVGIHVPALTSHDISHPL